MNYELEKEKKMKIVKVTCVNKNIDDKTWGLLCSKFPVARITVNAFSINNEEIDYEKLYSILKDNDYEVIEQEM
jgi:hypothetical protein